MTGAEVYAVMGKPVVNSKRSSKRILMGMASPFSNTSWVRSMSYATANEQWNYELHQKLIQRFGTSGRVRKWIGLPMHPVTVRFDGYDKVVSIRRGREVEEW